ncbi:MAG: undecaprenyl-diphosphatase UppP [Candidatus Kapabacteria bacterium]|nr:undecaprenyl-diphosphatase UppP [Candidatus Kapabacteria bacterium]
MSIVSALVLGLIQGLTEFIPVSSTAHLTVAAAAFGVIDPAHPERWTSFMATIQLGTLVAVLAYFRSDILRSASAWVRENLGRGRRAFREQGPDSRLGWFVIVGTIPIVVVGLAFKDILEGALTKNLQLIGISLIGMALLLWLAEKKASFTRTVSDLKIADALSVGAAQCLALIPGSSRSGSTIMAALFRGMTREHAARFSFLLSIPAVLAAGLLEFAHELRHLSWDDGGFQLLVATLAALVSGYWSIAFLLKYLRTHSMRVFILYRIALGSILLFTSCTSQEKGQTPVIEQLKPPPTSSRPVSADTIIEAAAEASDTVVIKTSKGSITAELYGKDAPATVANFLGLVDKHYYDGILFHRVWKDYVLQAGDPRTKVAQARSEWGRGGQTASGKPLIDELRPGNPSVREGYRKGILAMAHKPAPNSGTSQFFICLDKAVTLPYQYTIFGDVIEGMDVVDKIGRVEIEPGPLGETDGIPRLPVVIISIKRK